MAWLIGVTLLAAIARPVRGDEPAATVTADGPALLRDWTPPVYPPELAKEKLAPVVVVVRAIVDDQGRVTSARVLKSKDPRFDAAALAAVKSWGFLPAVEEGHNVACCLDAPVEFVAKGAGAKRGARMLPPERFMPQPAPRTGAEPLASPPGDYPAVLTERRLPGQVVFAAMVTPEGKLTAVEIGVASHVDFVLPALEALKHWTFTPAQQGDLPVKTRIEGEVSFSSAGGESGEVLAANGIFAPDGAVAVAGPEPRFVADAVWPWALPEADEGGTAEVEFTVGRKGTVISTNVRTASRPELGRAVVAALEACQFRPAISDGQTVSSSLLMRAKFAPPADEAGKRLLAELRAGTVSSAKGLDARLQPVWRVAPIYPRTLSQGERPVGNAVVEIVIDRDGRVRFPRALSATQEEFGWAAVTAAAQWVFQPPMRGGQPVAVRVRVPFEFKPD